MNENQTMNNNHPDFEGCASKFNVRCTDGKTISQTAFSAAHGKKVPLVWQHYVAEPENILGHAYLEVREDGLYAKGYFNNNNKALQIKNAVMHGDLDALSVCATEIRSQGGIVTFGNVREISLCVAGANPGAKIENITIQHSDGTKTVDPDEAIITSGICITVKSNDVSTGQNGNNQTLSHSNGEKSIKDIYDAMTDDEKDVVAAIVAAAIKPEGGSDMSHTNVNLFESQNKDGESNSGILKHSFTADDKANIMKAAIDCGSFKSACVQHAQTYGIEPIDILFPDAKAIMEKPDFIKRNTEWVSSVVNAAHHSPFSRIKMVHADITADEARAKGYVKGNLKKDEVIKLLKRVTSPTTIYKKQKFDRDDLIDITWDIIPWILAEMRLMLNEEIARAVILGDGREEDDEDKINEDAIRPIYKEADLYTIRETISSSATPGDIIERVIRSYENYNGSGGPVLFTTYKTITDMLLIKDGMGRRLYNTMAELSSALMVSKIIEVPVMKNQTRTAGGKTYDLLGIIVNMKDYTIGADKGGEISSANDFDIDYNQYKYLLETRISGSLTVPKSAIILEKESSTTPTKPPSTENS